MTDARQECVLEVATMQQLIDEMRKQLGVVASPDELQIMKRDGRDIIDVSAHDLIAYVPHDPATRAQLKLERSLLARIAPRLSFGIPRPLGTFEDDAVFDLRMRVRGTADLAFHRRALADSEQSDRFASWMANALAELHCSLSTTEILELNLRRPSWPLDSLRLRVAIAEYLEDSAVRDQAYAVADRWRDWQGRDSVLVHGDFGSHNFAFDPESGLPIGLFDFLDHGCASHLYDFKFIPSYGPQIEDRVRLEYAAQTSVQVDPNAVALFHAAVALSYLAWRVEEPERHDTESGRTREQGIAWATKAVIASSP